MRMCACEESARVHLVVVVVGVRRPCRFSENGKRTHRRPHSTLLVHFSPTSMHYRAHRVSINKPLYIPTGCSRDGTSKLRIVNTDPWTHTHLSASHSHACCSSLRRSCLELVMNRQRRPLQSAETRAAETDHWPYNHRNRTVEPEKARQVTGQLVQMCVCVRVSHVPHVPCPVMARPPGSSPRQVDRLAHS
jgi:hypothetical protein